MVAVNPIMDVLTGTPSADENALAVDDRVRIAAELVAAALDEHAHAQAIDSCGPRNKGRRYLVGPNAPLFRRMHEDWLASAESLLARVRAMGDAGHAVHRMTELQDAVALTRGLLSFTMTKIELGVARIRGGDFVTLEEVRSGLRSQARE